MKRPRLTALALEGISNALSIAAAQFESDPEAVTRRTGEAHDAAARWTIAMRVLRATATPNTKEAKP